MNLLEYSRLDGLALNELVHKGQVLPGELAELALRAIEQLNPRLNAVIESYPERAKTQWLRTSSTWCTSLSMTVLVSSSDCA